MPLVVSLAGVPKWSLGLRGIWAPLWFHVGKVATFTWTPPLISSTRGPRLLRGSQTGQTLAIIPKAQEVSLIFVNSVDCLLTLRWPSPHNRHQHLSHLECTIWLFFRLNCLCGMRYFMIFSTTSDRWKWFESVRNGICSKKWPLPFFKHTGSLNGFSE